MNSREAREAAKQKVTNALIGKWAKRNLHESVEKIQTEANLQFEEQRTKLHEEYQAKIQAAEAELKQKLAEVKQQESEVQRKLAEQRRKLGLESKPTDGIQRRIDLREVL